MLQRMPSGMAIGGGGGGGVCTGHVVGMALRSQGELGMIGGVAVLGGMCLAMDT